MLQRVLVFVLLLSFIDQTGIKITEAKSIKLRGTQPNSVLATWFTDRKRKACATGISAFYAAEIDNATCPKTLCRRF